MIEKPISIVREEFIKTLAEVINGCKLPPFIISNVLEDFLRAIKILENNQLKKDKEEYEKEVLKSKDKMKNDKI